MSWIQQALAALAQHRSVQVRPRGGSMRGRIEDGQRVTLAPASVEDVQVNDVVLVRWKRSHLLHLALAIEPRGVLIGNNLGKVNGWVAPDDVIAKVVD